MRLSSGPGAWCPFGRGEATRRAVGFASGATMINISTADLCDKYFDIAVAEPLFVDFGGLDAFHGRIATLKLFEDNALVRTLLEEAGNGRVLVIDGGGSTRCALIGGALAALAVTNGWRGALVNGCVRDIDELRSICFGIKAIAAHPRKSQKGLHTGCRNLQVHFAGVSFSDGDWLYADPDGVVLSKRELLE